MLYELNHCFPVSELLYEHYAKAMLYELNDIHFREFRDPAPKLGIGQFARFRITL